MSEPAFLLDQMTWPEVAEALKTVKVALLATGSCEQHGPHLELRTDTVRAYEVARKLAAAFYPQVLLAPALPVGQSEHHLAFAGTLSLRPSTYAALLTDVLHSLHHHGLKKFLIINGHGGNMATLNTVAARFRNRYPVKVAISGVTPMVSDIVKNFTQGRRTGHACEVEVSQAMVLEPALVRLDKLAPGEILQEPLTYTTQDYATRIAMPYRFDEVTANGALGDATQWDETFGRQMVETFVERVSLFLREFIAQA